MQNNRIDKTPPVGINMQANKRYIVTIRDLYTVSGTVICGAKVEVAILDGGIEVDRLMVSGKVGPGGAGYRRSYVGKPGLTARLVSGSCGMQFTEEDAPLTSEA